MYQESSSRMMLPYQHRNVMRLEVTKVNIGGEIIDIPTAMLENANLFCSIFTKTIFNSLPLHRRQYLCNFLPKVNGHVMLDEQLTNAFSKDPVFNFPNTFEKIRYKIKNNHFDPMYIQRSLRLHETRRVMYDHFQRQYNINMLKKLMLSRHEILEKAYLSIDGNQPSISNNKKEQKKNDNIENNIKKRAGVRVRKMLEEVKKQAKDPNPLSSDDEEIVIEKKKVVKSKSTLYNSKLNDIDLHEPCETLTIKKMLKDYKRLKEYHPDSPSLDTEGITLFDVYGRAGLSTQLEKNFGSVQKVRNEKKLKLPFIAAGRGTKK
uniref:Uncharacterized protein n=1 Tax=Parastrongyloides trichosuri TaxID=131310 RepID=A0A0N4ZEK3_PARTI